MLQNAEPSFWGRSKDCTSHFKRPKLAVGTRSAYTDPDANIQICTLSDHHYPTLLKQIYAPPPLLFVKGDIRLCNAPTIAIVGSRSFTSYGKETAYRLSSDLARSGITVVSGMALGIDTHAHRGALEKGATAAVLGSSLDCPYPPQNRSLFHQISKQGVVISEFPLGTTPEAHNFPRRNRILELLYLECFKKSASNLQFYLQCETILRLVQQQWVHRRHFRASTSPVPHLDSSV